MADAQDKVDPGSAASAPALSVEVKDLSLRFGGHIALNEVSFLAAAGRVTGLIGPNGAGKTSLLNCLSGLYQPYAGEMLLGGLPLSRRAAQHRILLGMGRTFQHAELVEDMTVFENVMVGADSSPRKSEPPYVRAGRALANCGLDHAAHREVATLSYGERKRVDVARALSAAPTVLLLDEPMSGLAPDERALMEGIVRRVRSFGVTQIVVEHDVAFVARCCDHTIVLAHGRLIANGSPSEVLADPNVVSAYLGRLNTADP